MEQLFLFSICVPTLMLAWRYLVRPAVLEHHRDRLFDLRDQLRTDFNQRNALDKKLYQELRDLINVYLLYTEKLNIWEVSFMRAAIARDKKLTEHLEEVAERRFRTDDSELRTIATQVRKAAHSIGVSYMVFSSTTGIALSMVLYPVIAILICMKQIVLVFRKSKNAWAELQKFCLGAINFIRGDSGLWAATRATLFAIVIAPAAVEAAPRTNNWSQLGPSSLLRAH